MLTSILSSTFGSVFLSLQPVFTQPSFENFVVLAAGWILCSGRHTISRVIQAGRDFRNGKHHASFYRFFSRARWIPDALGQRLTGWVLRWIPADQDVIVVVDDTLCHRSGPHLWGAAMHYDAARSTYGRRSSQGRQVRFSFGHNWVILSIWVPLPWNPDRGVALPVVFRLYRSRKRCPESEYSKRTQMAAEMIVLLRSWVPAQRKIVLTGDTEYACQTVLSALPQGVQFVGPLPMDAALYEPPASAPRGKRKRGRTPKKGKRLLNPKQLAEKKSIPWKRYRLRIYGRRVSALVKTQVGLWYHATGTRPVRMIVTRDPKGRIEDRAYLATDPSMSVGRIATTFSRRWSQEVTHREVKQHLGGEDPQNGWWRRRRGKPRPPKKIAGPQPHPVQGEKAARRTAPFAFFTYTLVVLWYFEHGSADQDVQRVRALAPWYRHKKEPSFTDMLHAAQRELTRGRILSNPSLRSVSRKILRFLSRWPLAG